MNMPLSGEATTRTPETSTQRLEASVSPPFLVLSIFSTPPEPAAFFPVHLLNDHPRHPVGVIVY